MDAIQYIFVFLLAFIGTELFSWAIHKYLMHGLLWKIHKSHHMHSKGFFELNDLFSAFFGLVSVLLIVSGAQDLGWSFWVGSGIATYGMLYFFLHDALIHKRVKIGNQPRKGYLGAVASAHRAHHRTNTKNDAESFGLFIIPKKFLNG